MAEDLYDLFFAGEIMQGKDRQQVRSTIARLFSADDQAVARLFSGTPVKIKSAVAQETAIKYRVAFRDAGALLDIRPVAATKTTTTPPPGDAPAEKPEATKLQLLPPMTGSLIDCAAHVNPAPIADISAIALAPEGTPIDETEPVSAAAVNTDDLTLAPAASGTLEDCQKVVEPGPLPDISGMTLIDES